MKLNAYGNILVTVVDGTTLTGLYAVDGSLNVYDATSDTTPGGYYHPCGAVRVSSKTPGTITGLYAPNGSVYITEVTTTFGAYSEDGGYNVVGFFNAGPTGDGYLLEIGDYLLAENTNYLVLE